MRLCAGRFAINRPSHGRLKLLSTGGAPALKFTVKWPSGRGVDSPPQNHLDSRFKEAPLKGSQTYVGNPGFIWDLLPHPHPLDSVNSFGERHW